MSIFLSHRNKIIFFTLGTTWTIGEARVQSWPEKHQTFLSARNTKITQCSCAACIPIFDADCGLKCCNTHDMNKSGNVQSLIQLLDYNPMNTETTNWVLLFELPPPNHGKIPVGETMRKIAGGGGFFLILQLWKFIDNQGEQLFF